MTNQTEQTIREFIAENFLFTGDASALSSNQSLLEADILNSTGVLEVVMFLEERFGFKVADNEVVPKNFDSVNSLTAYVEGKLAAGAAKGAIENAA
jgi:acyl carrier protein